MDLSTLTGVAAWIGRASCSATAVASVILLTQWALRKWLSPGMRYALWFVLVARLALPLSPQSRWSVFNAARLSPAISKTLAGPRMGATTPVVPLLPDATLGSKPTVAPATVVTPSVVLCDPATDSPIKAGHGSVERSSERPVPPVMSAPKERIRPAVVCAWIWLAGAVCFTLRLAGQNIAFGLRLRSARRVTEPALLQLLAEAVREIGVARAPDIFETDAVISPALCGLRRPRLLLPPGLAGSLALAELRFVFLHELAHLKRRDLIMNWVMAGLQVLHWFNPALWFAFGRMRADRELACDALALARAGDGENRAYGATLLKILSAVSRPVAAPGLVGIAEDMSQLKARMRMIAAFRNRSPRRVVPLLFLVFLAVVTLTDARTDQPAANATAPASKPEEGARPGSIAESTLAQDGRLLLEMGKLDEAEAKLQEALRRQPDDKHAAYYLDLIREARIVQAARKREISAKLLVEAEQSRSASSTTKTNLTRTSRGQQTIYQKLDKIILDEVRYDALPLSEVARNLVERARQLDPDKVGINIILNPTLLPAASGGDANHSPSGPASLNDVIIRLVLKQVRLGEVIDAVCKVAETPLQYAVEDYAVVITQRTDQSANLFTRTFRVDPNSFLEGLRAVFGNTDEQVDPLTGPIDISKGQVGKPGDIPDGHLGISGTTSPKTSTATVALVRRFFAAAGVDFSSSAISVDANGLPQPSGKALFFNDRTGLLLVRATMQELDTVEKAIQVANTAPPQIAITARLIELPSSNQSKALGFDWFLGNTTLPTGATNSSGASTNEAAGVFPGGSSANSAPVPTAMLRTAPPATGILTDKQAQAVIRAIEGGAMGRTLANPTVTTLSGRQIRTEIPSAGFLLDVLPTALADGYTVRLGIDFKLSPGVGGNSEKQDSAPEHPAPLRTSTSALVWDGQTLLFGPFPIGEGEKRVLLLVTPTLVDPAGNRVHAGQESAPYHPSTETFPSGVK